LKRTAANKKRFLRILILFMFLLIVQPLIPCSLSATDITGVIPQDIFPLNQTKIELREQKITNDWSEKTTLVEGFYHLFNPTEKTIKLKLGFCFPTPSNPPTEEITSEEITTDLPFHVFYQEEEITTEYNTKIKGYVWEIPIEPQTEVELGINYILQNETDEAGLQQTGYQFPLAKNKYWPNESYDFSYTLNFQDTHPGQITNLTPSNYSFKEDSLVWSWKTTEEKKNILITADILTESESWLTLFSTREQNELLTLTDLEEYQDAAFFLENRYHNYSKTEDKQLIALGQAYYLKKAGETKKSSKIFADLVKDDALLPRAYWETGKSYEQNPNKLSDLLNQIQELRIHALLQPWLIAKIPSQEAKLSSSPPEITIKYADTNEDRKGIVIKSQIGDKDGDISQIILRYHWEGESDKEVSFDIVPFQYDYEILHFTDAPGSFKQFFYEFAVFDTGGHEVTTGIKEAFYLNKEIESNTFILDGANLILGDYSPDEETKVHRWFKSYLKMASEAGFVPVEARSPLLIFMGQQHDFFKDYQGPLFVYYTSVPFSPNTTKIPVHRYFLSYWYGQGWHTLPLNELTTLGDALMLNKGWQARNFAYLQNKDHKLFAELLCTIGDGKNWTEALNLTYHLTPLKLNLLTVWFFIGNYVLAFMLIIIFTWLSKNGHLTKFFQHIKTAK